MTSTVDDGVLDAGEVGTVSVAVHRPAEPHGPAVLLVHGAGGAYDSPPLVALATGIAEAGHVVVRANLPYREQGRRTPPRADRSVPAYATVAAAVRGQVASPEGWIVGGKSYGGRVASMGVADGSIEALGLLFYGYPLHAPGKPDRLRVEHWPDVGVPCLFLQGSRDTFGSPDLLADNLRRLPRRATLHVVDGGDHSLRVAGASSPDGRPREAVDVVGALGSRVCAWADGIG